MTIFIELSLIVLVAAAMAMVMRLLRQPLIVGYIIAGILAGPYIFNILESVEQIELFSKIGITALLFIVGLHLSPKIIKDVGVISLITGLGQVIFTSVIGFGIAIALGFQTLHAVYIAIALTFSSTIIILKLLSDKGDLGRLYGRISIGFLLVQDIVATLILIIVSSFAEANGSSVWDLAGMLFLKAFLIGFILFLITRYFLSGIVKFMASSQELLFLFSLAWGLGMASIFTILGFSVEIGALVAGITLSSTPFASEIGSRMKPLRDFFIVLFFILLGSQMVLDDLGSLIIPAILFSVFVLVGNPIIVIILMNLFGYKTKTGFQAGLTVAQISEFSLILIAMAYAVGHVNGEVVSLVTLVGLVTIALSTYLIMYSDKIYKVISPALKLLEFRKKGLKKETITGSYEILLFGFDRVGADFVHAFEKLKRSYAVIDYNPLAVEKLITQKVPGIYGDASDVEFLQELDMSNIKMCISSLPEFETNKLLVQHTRDQNEKAIIIVIASNHFEATALYEAGASYVFMPHYLGAQHISKLIEKHGFSINKFTEEKIRHQQYIEKKLKGASVWSR